jgi:hypothetical protein
MIKRTFLVLVLACSGAYAQDCNDGRCDIQRSPSDRVLEATRAVVAVPLRVVEKVADALPVCGSVALDYQSDSQEQAVEHRGSRLLGWLRSNRVSRKAFSLKFGFCQR